MMSEEHRVEVHSACVDAAGLDINVPHLRNIMERAGCNASPDQFLQFVSLAYRSAQRTLRVSDAAFEALTSHKVLTEGLRQAAWRLTGAARILVLGCGDDFVGRSAAYASDVVRDVIPPEKISMVRTWNLAHADLHAPLQSHEVGRYDLVITNSLLHFIAELGTVLRHISGLLVERGIYLMAHEPNTRFWTNQTLREERRCMSVETTPTWRQRALRLSSYQLKVRKLFGRKPPVTLGVLTNRYLADQCGLRGGLADHEIACIVDPHRPCEVGGGFQIGSNGFGVEQLSQSWERRSRPIWMRSYDHLGYIDYPELPEKWKRRDRDLARLYPDDGSSWTALWIVNEPA